MRRLALASPSLLVLAAVTAAVAQTPRPRAAPEVVAHTVVVSGRTALITFEFSDGRGIRIALEDGRVRLNNELVGDLIPGSLLGQSWRSLLDSVAALEPAAALTAVRTWHAPGLTPNETRIKARLAAAIARSEAVPLPPLPFEAVTRTAESPDGGGFGEGEGADGFTIELGVGEQLAGVFGVLLAFAGMGVGLTMFGRRYLETVADTLKHTPGRAFATGLLAQVFFLPVLILLCLGLALTIIGLVVIPILVLAYWLGGALCVVLGMLAAAHALGEAHARRRMARGVAAELPSAFGYLVRGLVMIGIFWLIAVLFGWIPLAGWVVKVLAGLVTWFVLTAGAGAVLLSRFGVRDTFAGRMAPALTDEFLWATPVGTSPIKTVKRPTGGEET